MDKSSKEKPYVIGITGGSGSGKTSFIRHLRQSFSEEELCVLSQDDYYLPREDQRTDNQGVKNFDLPESIKKEDFIRDVRKLLNWEVVQRQEYVFNNEKAVSKLLTFKPAPIILVEGIFVFHFSEIRELLNLKIFLHAKEVLKVIRRIKRDKLERNYPLDDVLYRYQYHVMPTFEKYIKPYKDEADLIINNNEQFDNAFGVVKGFVRNKLG